MELILGLLLPVLVLAAVGLRRGDGGTHWRYFIAPLVLALIALVAVLTADPAGTPDFWVGFCASLAAIAAAAVALVVEGFLPISWWTREARPRAPDA